MGLPPAQGLYDPRFEHDACGLGFVATLNRTASHDVVKQALEILVNLTHRGAAGCDPCTGDGAGILLQIPHDLFASADSRRARLRAAAARRLRRRDVLLLAAPGAPPPPGGDPRGRRRAPRPARASAGATCPSIRRAIGPVARESMPVVRQLFIGREPTSTTFEQQLYLIRKRAGRRAHEELGGDDFYIASASSRTVVYKGLMLAEQVAAFYPDLADPRCASKLAMVHSRFSTNTFPSWERAHPFRLIAHNGEINTLSGNRAWMAAREALLKSDVFGAAIEDFKPIMRPGGSDSASLDNVVDFLVASGRSLPHVMMMLIPEGVRQRSRHVATRRRRSTPTTAVSSSRGTGRRRSPSPTACRSAPCSIATGCARPSTSSPRDGLVVLASRVRRAADSIRRAWCKRGACSRARCSSSTPTPGASSPTRRSSTRSPRRSRIASGSTRTASTLSMLPEAAEPVHVEPRRGARACSRRSATPRRI